MSCDTGHAAKRLRKAVASATGKTLPSDIICKTVKPDGSRYTPRTVEPGEAIAAINHLKAQLPEEADCGELNQLAESIMAGEIQLTEKQIHALRTSIPEHLNKNTLPIPDSPELQALAAKVKENGGEAYLVGGAVRDMLAGAQSKDLDVEVFGIPQERLEEILEEVGNPDLVGKQFAVYKLGELDVALPRRETKTAEGYKGFDVVPDHTMTVDEAAQRRDFTINAISVNLATGEVVDPAGGRADLNAGVLRHVGPAFAEDPLRVLRGAQFAARFNLTPAPETVEMAKTLIGEKHTLPRERVNEEWNKLLNKGKKPSLGLKFLKETGWLPPEMEPEFATISASADRAAKLRGSNPAISWAAVTYHMDEKTANKFLNANIEEKKTAHEALRTRNIATELSSKAVSETRLRELADQKTPLREAFKAQEAATGELNREAFATAGRLGILDEPLPVLVTGDDLIRSGVKEGPEIGRILKQVRSQQTDGKVSTREAALTLLANLVGKDT